MSICKKNNNKNPWFIEKKIRKTIFLFYIALVMQVVLLKTTLAGNLNFLM